MTYFASSGRFVLIPRDKSKGLKFFSIDKLGDPAIESENYDEDDGQTYADFIDAKYIYDVWYWGDEPMSTNEYHANAHIETN